MSNQYVSYIPSRSGKARVFFKKGSFLTSVKENATKFDDLVALQKAMQDAYKAYKITGDEMNSYSWTRA